LIKTGFAPASGEIEVLKFQVEGEQAKVKGLKAIAGESGDVMNRQTLNGK
jgi:hypothetical protein